MKQGTVAGIIAVAACVFANTTTAQDRLKLELGYNISMPTGSFKNNEVNNTSFRGAFGEISYPVSNKLSVGLMAGYQSYQQKYDRQLYTTRDRQTISAVKTNSIDVMPLLLRGTFFPTGGSGKLVQPYVSAGAGVNFVNYSQYLGEFGSSETAFPLAVQAGAGVIIPVGSMVSQTGIKIGATYNYSGYTKNDMNTKLGNIGVHAGVVFPLR
jgi:opacity protein-like surface antigen